ncbi:MAG: hypothetical protein PHS04_06890 [Tissierellia bacterium]|nr:hypothetical protein [Tissierellia bacterium]
MINCERAPMPSVAVTAHPVGSQTILTYTMTANDGTFILKSNSLPDSVTVSVRAMTIESQSKSVKRDVGFLEFVVNERVTELKEIIVKAPKIRQADDTINYSVSSFMDETDRSIGDVLKKLPGIQVLSSGQILFQNKEISKFYVEGLDLLQGKYGLATNNIDAKQVATVQVLENHQPIKVLNNVEIPDNAAINLKLKQSSLGAFFLTAQVGAGPPPVLLSDELVGMRFTRVQQNMMVYKGDNTGRDIAREVISFYNNMRSSTSQFLSVQAPSPPSIREQHYLFNDAHLFSLNDLRTLKKDLTLTSNVNYLHDTHKSNSFSRRDISVGQGQTILIEENLSSRLSKRELDGNLILEKNTEKHFLENKLRISSNWNGQTGDVETSSHISQQLNQPSFQIENDFNFIHKKEDKRVRLGANVSYRQQNSSLLVSPILFNDFFTAVSPNDTEIKQNLLFNHFNANFYLSGGKERDRFSSDYRVEAFTTIYNVSSDMFVNKSETLIREDSLQNKIKRNEAGVELMGAMSYRISRNTRVYVAVPLKILYLDKQDKIRDSRENKIHFLFSSRLGLQHPINARTKFLSSLSVINNIGSVSEDYRGYIMNTYRSLLCNNGILSRNRNIDVYTSIDYKNPFTTLFTTLSLSYTNFWKNMLYDVQYSGILNHSISIEHPNNSHALGVNFSMGQSIDAINSEIKFFARYNRNNSIVLNQDIISDFFSNSYTLSPSINTSFGQHVIVNYNASYNNNRNTVRNERIPEIHHFTQALSTSFIPVKKLIFNISFNHYFNSLIKSGARSSWFGNLGVRYKLKNVDVMLDWTNIFNTRRFVTYSYSDVSSYYSEYTLRPAEVLLRVRFKIL